MPAQGDVWLTRFDPVEGHEQGGRRPALIISNDRFNRLPSGLIIVVPTTTRDRRIPFHLRVEPPAGGFNHVSFLVSFLLCDQPRTPSTSRLLRRLGAVSDDTVRAVQQLVGLFIDR